MVSAYYSFSVKKNALIVQIGAFIYGCPLIELQICPQLKLLSLM